VNGLGYNFQKNKNKPCTYVLTCNLFVQILRKKYNRTCLKKRGAKMDFSTWKLCCLYCVGVLFLELFVILSHNYILLCLSFKFSMHIHFLRAWSFCVLFWFFLVFLPDFCSLGIWSTNVMKIPLCPTPRKARICQERWAQNALFFMAYFTVTRIIVCVRIHEHL
jgi:hypothetical protein